MLLAGSRAFGTSHVEKIYDLPAGSDCESALIVGPDGTMYGTTRGGGLYSQGSVFSITTTGSFATLYSFSGLDGADPRSSLTCGTNGQLYGTTAEGGSANMGTLFLLSGTTLQTLHSFTGPPDGATPGTALIWRNGYLYGATAGGGFTSSPGGTFFKISPGGNYQLFYTFPEYADVSSPSGNFLLAGTNLVCCGRGGVGDNSGGTIVIDGSDQVQNEGAFGHDSGMQDPNGSLIEVNGNFYGTSRGFRGGLDGEPGSVFSFVTLIHLYSVNGLFNDGFTDYPHYTYDEPEGTAPLAGLTDATNGDLLGSNSAGGANGDGTLFRVDLTLTSYFLEQAFCFGDFFSFGGTYGSGPVAAMVAGTDGNFYGATTTGGANGGGTVYRVLQNRRPNALDFQAVRVPGQPLRVDFLSAASDPDGDPLTFVGYVPDNVPPDYWPGEESPGGFPSNGIVTLSEDYYPVGQFAYVVSDGMDVALGYLNVVYNPTPNAELTNTYTGTLIQGGTAVGTIQITTNITRTILGKNTGEQSTSLTGVFDFQGVSNNFAANNRESKIGALDNATLTTSPAHGWHLTLTDEFDLQWRAVLTGPGGSYTLLLQPLAASGIVHQYYTASLAGTGTSKGDGFAFMVLDDVHTLRLAGKLPNGLPFTGSAGIGDWKDPITGMFGNADQVGGTIQISSLAGPVVTGTVDWQVGSHFHQAALTASPYTPQKSPQSALNLSHGRTCILTFTRPNGTSFAKSAALNAPNESSNTPGIGFVMNPQTGMLRGEVRDPSDKYWLPFQGAVMQQTNGAAGYLQEGSAFGEFTLTVKP